MKYLALLSGGKDSCFNLLHCYKNGHELVAAASLGPGPGKEELDSYLYQTVGQDAIEFVARALDVPLFRRVITGQAVEQGPEYGSRNSKDLAAVEGDETEDLFALLSEVKVHHPDVQGVSVGAILSSYQRVRVEHVCRRLNLTPLCYLWNRDQGELFNEMIDAGMEAIIIKVAGIGLSTTHLGKPLAQMRPTLIKLNNLYGAHICGEGGEYESLTLDCPLFKHRIVLTEVETVIHSDNDFATVAFLRIKNARLEPKPLQRDFHLRIPPPLEDRFEDVRSSMLAPGAPVGIPGLARSVLDQVVEDPFETVTRASKVGSWVSVANVHHKSQSREEVSLEDEVKECFKTLQEHLAEHSLTVSNCTNINIFISSMELFPAMNAVYSTFFGTSPPARACVAVDLPHPLRVRLDCIAFGESNPSERQALHVQGLSYWAPANIGPYSQAITAGERIFISGQIGLLPSQLTLPSPESLKTEMALASQHVARVVRVLKPPSDPSWVGPTQAAIYWLLDSRDSVNARKAHELTEEPQTPALYLVVKDLPKGALVEKQVLLHTGRRAVVGDDNDVYVEAQRIVYRKMTVETTSDFLIHAMTAEFEESGESCTIICVKARTLLDFSPAFDFKIPGRVFSVRLFYEPHRTDLSRSVCQSIFGNETLRPITPISCRSISTNEQSDWDCALCIISV